MEVAVQKDCVRKQLSASLQQCSVGCYWRNAGQTGRLSSQGSETHALSQDLLLLPVYFVRVSLTLTALLSDRHCTSDLHVTYPGVEAFSS